jgi:hypothetical protein
VSAERRRWLIAISDAPLFLGYLGGTCRNPRDLMAYCAPRKPAKLTERKPVPDGLTVPDGPRRQQGPRCGATGAWRGWHSGAKAPA